MADTVTVQPTVNGRAHRDVVPARMTLADYLRDRLRLAGTKVGCEQGVCGSCTVLLDGEPVRSCLVLAVQADGHAVSTVEGLADTADAAALRRELSRLGAIQCGFCVSGMLATSVALLGTGTPLDEARVREELSGNVCRCTGYQGIVDAVLAVAEARAPAAAAAGGRAGADAAPDRTDRAQARSGTPGAPPVEGVAGRRLPAAVAGRRGRWIAAGAALLVLWAVGRRRRTPPGRP